MNSIILCEGFDDVYVLGYYLFKTDKWTYMLNVVPVIIPFDRNGALETILLTAIEEIGEEDKFIVSEARNYVDKLLHSGKMKKYLRHDRQILKAEFSSVIFVTNPDRSTALFDTLLMSYPWEEMQTIKTHFKIFNNLL